MVMTISAKLTPRLPLVHTIKALREHHPCLTAVLKAQTLSLSLFSISLIHPGYIIIDK